MNGVLEAQVARLLELVEQHRSERCTQIMAKAQARRETLLQQAYAEARARMREAINAERRRSRETFTAARAQLQTRQRQRQHHTALMLLQQGWERLGQAVERRWNTAPQRRLWLSTLLQEALQRLPRCAWVIEHPPGWDAAEAGDLLTEIQAHCGDAPTWRANPQLHAGLRIRAEGACLDGTPDGLLADREAIEAQLLAQLHRLLAVNHRETTA